MRSGTKRTCRYLGRVPSSTYLKKVHKIIKGECTEHNLWTHVPKDPNCPICSQCKRTRAQCRQKVHAAPDDLPVPKKFADAITCDHKILNENDANRSSDRLALVVLGRFTQWLQGYPSKTRPQTSASSTSKNLLVHSASLNMFILITRGSLLRPCMR